MILTRTESNSWVGESLDRVDINIGFARAVTDNLVDGSLWLDRMSAPRAMHALHPYGMSLVWGDALDEVIDPLASHLREGQYRIKDEWLQIDPRWYTLDWDSLLGAIPAEAERDSGERCPIRFSRVNFGFDQERFLDLHGSRVVSKEWNVRRATESDFDMAGSVVPKHFWRSAPQFLAHGGGWCLERDGVVGAIAFSSFRFDNELELGIETAPTARRQGLGLMIAIVMIKDIIDAGLIPVWSCRRENTASYELALKLGFYVKKMLPYYWLPAR